jgi:hypothetical protein
MIDNHIIAQKVNALMLDVSSRIDDSIVMVQEHCPDAEFSAYRLAAGRILAEILLGVLNPLYSAHPTLRPPGLRG